MESLSLDGQIVFPAIGEKKSHIYVFTDVDCGYCRKFHREVEELNAKGVEVRYLAWPRDLGNPMAMADAKTGGTRSETYRKMVTAWCADDQLEAMTLLKAGKSAGDTTCNDHPIIEHYIAGDKLGIRGTPALVFADGTFQGGYVPVQQLLQRLGL